MRAIEAYEDHYVTRCALRVAPLLFVRLGELRHAEWAEFDQDEGLWAIPTHKMKMRREHLVPLPHQALAILKELWPLTGSRRYLFPSIRTSARPMNNNTMTAAYDAWATLRT